MPDKPDAWNPDQYERFRTERLQPAFDLMSLVAPVPGGRAIDLGCGTGEITRLLHEAVQAGETTGIDSSQAMLEKCRHHEAPGLRFVKGDIASFPGEVEYDLIFSNAALHWLPDHRTLFGRFFRALKPGGSFAAQIPANHLHPSHLAATELAMSEPYRTALQGWNLKYGVELPETYAAILHELGFANPLVMLKVYVHLLETREAVAEWYRGSLLTAYETRLDTDLFIRFMNDYRTRLKDKLPDTRPYLFTFSRILLRGTRPG